MTAAADRLRLVRALGRHRDIEDWTVRLTTTRTAWRGWGDRDEHGTAERAALIAELHRDQPKGRGSATCELAADGDATRAVADAMQRADDAIGPVWRSPSPAAPAKVELVDPAIDPAALGAALDRLVGALMAAIAPHPIARGFAEVAIDDVELTTRRGQRARWRASRLEVAVDVGFDGGGVGTIARRARRLDELDLAGALAAAQLAALHPDAAAPPPGSYPVALRAAALLHGGHGLLAALVEQADPGLERQGLVRYRVGRPIVDGATLSLDSDGTLPFGWRSAPLGDRGEPVRRFPLVTRGVAAGLGLDAREAALRGAQPNGGVRGLVVPPGDVAADELIRGGTVVVDELAWLEVEPTTGWFRAAIASGAIDATRIRGGILRGDAIALVARARRSREVAATPLYRGPALWHLGAVTIE